MKRGVFMLILKLTDERDEKKKVKGIFRKRIIYENREGIKRYSVNVNGKNIIVVELPKNMLECEDVLTLLKIYKGSVLVSTDDADINILKKSLFSPEEYYQRAVLSSLVNQIKSFNNEWKIICIKTESFKPFKELFEVVKISKSVILITKENTLTDKFLNECYYEYGSVVRIKGAEQFLKYDVFLNLDEVDDKGKLIINVKGKDFLLYPDVSYFQDNTEYQKLLPFNIEHNIICAAFSDK